MGRKTLYTDELAAEILDRLAQGETLRGICRDEHIPPAPTVRGWVVDDRNGFAERYARARGMGLDEHGEHMLEIADTTDDPAKARVQLDARKFLLSRLKPGTYGDRIEVEHTGDPPSITFNLAAGGTDGDGGDG